MFGFLFGTACLLGLTATVARRTGQERHHCGGGRAHGFRGRRARFVLNRLLDRLDTSPGQEKVIREAVETIMDEMRGGRREFAETRHELAQAIRSENLDRAAIDALFTRHDVVIDRLRQQLLDGFGKVHETLDSRQRKILAEIVESGPFGGFRPFR